MFLLNRSYGLYLIQGLLKPLHPIMFLLNRYHLSSFVYLLQAALHPIMFLLNRLLNMVDMTARSTLHPIMFLLNLVPAELNKFIL